MRVPTDRPLREWILELAAAGKLYTFYKTPEWLSLRAEVMADNHNECKRCAGRGEYSKADTVHHENEVRKRPDLALSRYYYDAAGVRHDNLTPLCNQCHNEVHGRFKGAVRKKPPITVEVFE